VVDLLSIAFPKWQLSHQKNMSDRPDFKNKFFLSVSPGMDVLVGKERKEKF
jgi:hypothetical protein